jgi:hypothetical protein
MQKTMKQMMATMQLTEKLMKQEQENNFHLKFNEV